MTSPSGNKRSICTAFTIAHILLNKKALKIINFRNNYTTGPDTFPESNVPSYPSTESNISDSFLAI